jgi:excisionase family DNA binding protein
VSDTQARLNAPSGGRSVVPGGLRELASPVNDPAKRAPDFPPGNTWSDEEQRPVYTHYTARETAEALGVTERTVRRWIDAGRLNATKEQGAFRIDISEAREVLADSRAGYSHGRASLQERIEWLEVENARLWALLEKAVTQHERTQL